MGLPSLLRRLNTADVLREIRSNGPVSRANVAKGTGLSQLTVNQIANRLLRAGHVIEEGGDARSRPSRRGRRTRLLRFNAAGGHVLGIDIAAAAVVVVVADLDGKIVSQERRPVRTQAQLHPTPFLSLVRTTIKGALAAARVPRSSLMAAGIGVPGRVDPRSGRISLVPALPGWDGLMVGNRLAGSLRCPIVVENAVHLAILAERGFGSAKAEDNAVYLHVGVGIGLGILVKGELYRGAAGAAGEIAFLPLCDADDPPEGDFGTFEWAAGSTAFARLGRSAASSPGGVTYGLAAGDLDRIDAHVVEAAGQVGASARPILERVAKQLARSISAVHGILDPGIIILGGEVTQASSLLLERLKELISVMTPRPLGKIVISSLGDEAVALGAVQVALRQVEERLFEVRPRTTLPNDSEHRDGSRHRLRSQAGSTRGMK